ncbi:unnamed protein product [Candidula unifasciata]|uniref:BZIP domain-containing protein n=1 Tax=Candidula unifasciata TaxID=100452 RepID=A0A8S3ZFR4_9EUPU|nr:unnamed protein product [Candidula unifasciata]
MSEAALDLSISSYDVTSQKTSRHHDLVSNDSGRASSDSTLSDIHEEIKIRLRTSPQATSIHPSFLGRHSPNNGRTLGGSQFSPLAQNSPLFSPLAKTRNLPELPPHLQLKNTSSVSSAMSSAMHAEVNRTSNYSEPHSPEQQEAVSGDDDIKPVLAGDRISEPRVAPIRPFKMYPVDPFAMYANPLMAGTGTMPSSTLSLQSLYDSSSPVNFPPFPLTPITSHLLQRKRRAENRESSSSGTATTSSSTINSGNSSAGIGSISVNVSTANGSTMVSTSSPGSSKEDSGGSDNERKGKSSMDVKKDDAYWDRRRKNNEAAKRSRDARRQKEEEIAMRAAYLEQENLKLRAQVAILKNETAKLHYMLYNRM